MLRQAQHADATENKNLYFTCVFIDTCGIIF